jgi:hypothetical protein
MPRQPQMTQKPKVPTKQEAERQFRIVTRAAALPDRIAAGASGKELDDLIERLVARDNLKPEG